MAIIKLLRIPQLTELKDWINVLTRLKYLNWGHQNYYDVNGFICLLHYYNGLNAILHSKTNVPLKKCKCSGSSEPQANLAEDEGGDTDTLSSSSSASGSGHNTSSCDGSRERDKFPGTEEGMYSLGTIFDNALPLFLETELLYPRCWLG